MQQGHLLLQFKGLIWGQLLPQLIIQGQCEIKYYSMSHIKAQGRESKAQLLSQFATQETLVKINSYIQFSWNELSLTIFTVIT